MHSTLKFFRPFFAQLLADLFQPNLIAITTGIAIFLGVAGPFGTFWGMGLAERFFYWGAVVASSIVLIHIIKISVRAVLPDSGYWQHALISSALMTALYVPIFSILTSSVANRYWRDIISITNVAAYVFAITIFVFLMRYLFTSGFRKPRARLFARFKNQKASQIFSITVRDHYVDISTNLGKETLLMRFSDALAELDGVAGLQVHRSHWVANIAVREFKKTNGRSYLVLACGTEVPVSRAYVDVVAAQFS